MPALVSVIDIRANAPESGGAAPYPIDRKRKWHSKVATGCLKCKERRIKCSEEKPGCRRCTKLGVACPGYRYRTARVFEIQPRTGPLFECTLEKERHDFFVDVGSKVLATFQLNSIEFWTRLAPQLGQRHPAVRHGLTALGAVQAPLHSLSLVQLQPWPRSVVSQLAMLHLQKSMHIFRTADPATIPVEVSLACCLLFTAMQFWVEKTASLHTHILAAYRILQERIGPIPSQWIHSSAISKEFAASYIPSLNEMINQACTFSDGFPPSASGIPLDYHHGLDLDQIATISSKEGTVDVVDRLLKCILRTNTQIPASSSLEQNISLAFEAIERKVRELQEGTVLRVGGYDWTHIRLHVQVAQVMFEGLHHNGEVEYDACKKGFISIVAYCQRLIHLDAADPPNTELVLSAHLGVLPPLFFVATKCRDPVIRHEALKLLHEASVSERGWTSCQAFCLASFVVEQERILNKLQLNAGTSDDIRYRISLKDIDVSGQPYTATITYEIYASNINGDSQHCSNRSLSKCSSEGIGRWRSTIEYPFDPVVELDGAPCPMPGKVLRASGYSSILLFRPPSKCHCERENRATWLTGTSKMFALDVELKAPLGQRS